MKYLEIILIKGYIGSTCKMKKHCQDQFLKGIFMSWKTNNTRMLNALQLIYRVNAMQIKIPVISNLIPWCTRKCQGQKNQDNLIKKKKKNKYNGRLSIPNLKTYEVVTLRTLWCEHQDRQVDQWSRIKRLGMNS